MIVIVAIPVAITVILGAVGYVLFTRASIDPIAKADAIIVLGGEHDGREAYGIALAEQGVADTVVLSDPYGPHDKTFQKWCASSSEKVTVFCEKPVPSTTRGEAIFTQELARQHGWKHVVVISWQYHLPRARYIFGQCFDGTVTMRAVPRTYDFSLAEWEFTYLYQLAGFVKAAVQGSSSCTDPSVT
ncbi:YdcF family protein [Rhodococcoides trifolii]